MISLSVYGLVYCFGIIFGQWCFYFVIRLILIWCFYNHTVFIGGFFSKKHIDIIVR